MVNPTRTIQLTGKHAVGSHAFCVVDELDFGWLTQWKWKAKPNANGTHVYAARNVVVDGKWRLIRMHREVAGYSGPLDVDHIDRNTMNNTRANLRAVTRSINCRNTDHKPIGKVLVGPPKSLMPKPRKAKQQLQCTRCHVQFFTHATGAKFCSMVCRSAHNKGTRGHATLACRECGLDFESRRIDNVFCSKKCIKRAAYRRTRALLLPIAQRLPDLVQQVDGAALLGDGLSQQRLHAEHGERQQDPQHRDGERHHDQHEVERASGLSHGRPLPWRDRSGGRSACASTEMHVGGMNNWEPVDGFPGCYKRKPGPAAPVDPATQAIIDEMCEKLRALIQLRREREAARAR
jgi:hypothetical protein